MMSSTASNKKKTPPRVDGNAQKEIAADTTAGEGAAADGAGGAGGAGGKAKRRRRKEKKQKIEISLWINGCKYEYGILCTFCTKIPAVCHCPECPDFYCEGCDTTAHNTKKRRDHVRTRLSKLDLATAAGLVTRAVRRYGHIRLLQDRCRKLFKRFFDRKTLNYYYFNPVYNTVSWREPYCLRGLPFAPFMSPDYAASKCQNLYHNWRARQRTREALLAQYRKIFDRRSGYFYYAFNGPSQLLPRSSWQKPRLLGRRSYPRDLLPVYTIDVAAVLLQRQWRGILVRRFLRALARGAHDEVWDPVRGRYNYYNRDHEQLHQEKPRIFGSEAWDPQRVPDWSCEEVSLFLRRIGLRQYVDVMRSYSVDGTTLYLLDDEDYENMNIFNRVHVRKIRVEIQRRYRGHGRTIQRNEAHEARREKIRRQKMFFAAAVKIQRNFRRFSAVKHVAMLRELRRLRLEEEELQRRIAASRVWWTDRPTLPVRDPAVAAGWTTVQLQVKQRERQVLLPPIKRFGRSRDYLSHRGWGRRGSRATHGADWIPTVAAQVDPRFCGDSHVTRVFIDRLHRRGYDASRMAKFELESRPGFGLQPQPRSLSLPDADGDADGGGGNDDEQLQQQQQLQLPSLASPLSGASGAMDATPPRAEMRQQQLVSS